MADSTEGYKVQENRSQNHPHNDHSTTDRSKPLITVKEARKILAQEGSELSDDQIGELIHNMEKLAEYGLEMAQVRKSAVV